jgi:hypothetical protein
MAIASSTSIPVSAVLSNFMSKKELNGSMLEPQIPQDLRTLPLRTKGKIGRPTGKQPTNRPADAISAGLKKRSKRLQVAAVSEKLSAHIE